MAQSLLALKRRFHVFLEDNVLYAPKRGSKKLPARDLQYPDIDPENALDILHKEGAVTFPKMVSQDAVAELRQVLDDAIAGKRPDLKHRYSDEAAGYYIDNPLDASPVVANLALNPFLLKIIESYFQHDCYLSDMDYRRLVPITMGEFEKINPSNASGYSSCHWHYDTRGRQLKIMIYLTDVKLGGQNFAFCKGTHRNHPSIKRDRLDYDSHRFKDGWPEKQGMQIDELVGGAGTLLLFDTNGVHRLRRSPQAVRDSITFYYTPGQQLKPLTYSDAAFERIPRDLRRFLGGKRCF